MTAVTAEAMGIDGHLIIEQTVRSKNGFFLNFNGTAGLWRLACIKDAGGWQWTGGTAADCTAPSTTSSHACVARASAHSSTSETPSR